MSTKKYRYTSQLTRHISHVTKHAEYILDTVGMQCRPFASVHIKLITKDEAYILRFRLKLSLLKQTLLDVKK